MYLLLVIIIYTCTRIFFRLSDRPIELSSAADKTQPKKDKDTINVLMSFINNIEEVLQSEHAVMSDQVTMQSRIQRFKELQTSLASHQNNFEYVNRVGQDLISKMDGDAQSHRFKEELQDLNTKWSDVPILLEERLQKLSKGIHFSRNLPLTIWGVIGFPTVRHAL